MCNLLQKILKKFKKSIKILAIKSRIIKTQPIFFNYKPNFLQRKNSDTNGDRERENGALKGRSREPKSQRAESTIKMLNFLFINHYIVLSRIHFLKP